MNKSERFAFTIARRVLKFLALIGIVVFTWSSSILWIKYSDILYFKFDQLVSILFGAASLALFVFSIFIALLAIVGWQAFKDIVQERVNAATESLENEIRGRVLSVLGYIIGEMSLTKDLTPDDNRRRLREAVDNCQMGYDFLEKVGGPAEFMALNNLLYYTLVSEDETRRDFLVEQAHRLMKAGQKHNATNLSLTACGVLLRYGTKQEEVERALNIARALEGDPSIPERQRKEAGHYLASYLELAKKSPTTSSKGQNIG